jgi:hypothetical protein
MLLGTLALLLAGVWKFMTQKPDDATEPPLTRLFAVMDDVRRAQNEADLAKAEMRIDEILRGGSSTEAMAARARTPQP